MKIKCLLFSLTVVFAFTGCYNDTYQDLYVSPTAPNACDTATNAATYSGSVKSILTSKCAVSGCHNAATRQSNYDFSTFQDSKIAADLGRLVHVTAVSKTMPPSTFPPLTECEIKQIAFWVDHSSQNN